MTITRTDEGERAVFALEGRLDTNTSPELEQALEAFFTDGGTVLDLDFQKLAYLSSAGLRVLLGAQKKINAAGGDMRILGASQVIHEIFDVTGFSGFLQIV